MQPQHSLFLVFPYRRPEIVESLAQLRKEKFGEAEDFSSDLSDPADPPREFVEMMARESLDEQVCVSSEDAVLKIRRHYSTVLLPLSPRYGTITVTILIRAPYKLKLAHQTIQCSSEPCFFVRHTGDCLLASGPCWHTEVPKEPGLFWCALSRVCCFD